MAEVPSEYVYLDYAATAPMCEEAAAAMAPYQVPGRANLTCGGNANSLHAPGRAAFAAMEGARRSLARDLGARRPDEIIMTSGATESDNAALLGIAHAAVDVRRRQGAGAQNFIPHIIVSSIEHEAVLAPAQRLEAQGYRVTYLTPNAQGFIEEDALKQALTSDTVLVSVQAANSEVGSIQPVARLARAAHEAGALFHTDAVQILGKAPVNVGAWDVDAASFSAHKVGGPKGIGVLYLRARTPFQVQALGGGQEAGRRSGTQNVAGMVGFAAAVHAVQALEESESARLRALRDQLYAEASALPNISATVSVLANATDFLPNIVHLLADGFESETLILRLDSLGFGVSGGSACAAHSLEPSRVLSALGIERDRALGALRISMGRYTTEDDIRRFVQALKEALTWE